jgi:hypothetical protein
MDSTLDPLKIIFYSSKNFLYPHFPLPYKGYLSFSYLWLRVLALMCDFMLPLTVPSKVEPRGKKN